MSPVWADAGCRGMTHLSRRGAMQGSLMCGCICGYAPSCAWLAGRMHGLFIKPIDMAECSTTALSVGPPASMPADCGVSVDL